MNFSQSSKTIFTFLFLLSIALNSQTKQIDSVRNILPTLTGKDRLPALYFLSNKLEDLAPKEAQEYGLEGVPIAEQIGDSGSLATLYSSLAFSSSELGNFEQSIKNGYHSLEISTRINDKKRIASANSVLGITYVYLGQYSKALEHHLKALHLREELGLTIPTANTLNNIGIAYHHIGQYDKAIEYYKRAWSAHTGGLANLTKIRYLTNVGYSEFKRGNFDIAMKYHQEALALARQLNYNGGIAYIYFNLGIMLSEKKEYQQALVHLQQAVKIYDSLGQKYGTLQLLNAIASVYYQKGEYHQAFHYLDRSVELGKQINARDQLKISYETLYSIYNTTGPVSKALQYYKLYSEMNDSLMNTNESIRIAEIAAQFVTLQRDREIEQLKNEKMISDLNSERESIRSKILYSSVVLFIAIISFLYYDYRRLKKNKLAIEQMNKELLSVNDELQAKMNEIKLLTGLLPICAKCKKIRDDAGEWKQLEQYISSHSDAKFSHGICPDCMQALYGNVLKKYKEE